MFIWLCTFNNENYVIVFKEMKSKFPISYHIMESYYDTAEDLCAFYEVFEKYFYTVFVTENVFCVRKLNPRKSDDKKKGKESTEHG